MAALLPSGGQYSVLHPRRKGFHVMQQRIVFLFFFFMEVWLFVSVYMTKFSGGMTVATKQQNQQDFNHCVTKKQNTNSFLRT